MTTINMHRKFCEIWMGISCHCVSIYPSVCLSICPSRCSTEAAKHKITQIMPHDSTETLV